MAVRTITGALTIPASEQSSAGVYTDLVLQLVLVNGGIETIDQTSTVTTANNYSYTFDDSAGTAKKVSFAWLDNCMGSVYSNCGFLLRC